MGQGTFSLVIKFPWVPTLAKSGTIRENILLPVMVTVNGIILMVTDKCFEQRILYCKTNIS